MDKLGFGILGCGHIARRFVAGLNHVEDAQLVAVASTSRRRAQGFAHEIACDTAYSDYDDLLADKRVSVVYIATFNQNHADLIELALNAGKHVLCEKPMVVEVEVLHELFALANRKHLFLMEAQKAVFMPSVQTIKSWLEQSIIGTVKTVSASYGKQREIAKNHWVLDPEYGGAMLDVGVYPLAVVLYLFGTQYKSVESTSVIDDKGCDYMKDVTIRYAGFNAVCEGSFLRDLSNVLIIRGEKGTIRSHEFWKSNAATLSVGADENTFAESGADEFQFYIAHACECIRAGLTASPVMSEDLSAAVLTCALSKGKALNFLHDEEEKKKVKPKPATRAARAERRARVSNYRSKY